MELVLLAFALSLALFAPPQLILSARRIVNPLYLLFNKHFRSPLY